MRDKYFVVVGNIGRVYEGYDLQEAVDIYIDYVCLSENGQGPASGKDVTLMKNYQIERSFTGKNSARE